MLTFLKANCQVGRTGQILRGDQRLSKIQARQAERVELGKLLHVVDFAQVQEQAQSCGFGREPRAHTLVAATGRCPEQPGFERWSGLHFYAASSALVTNVVISAADGMRPEETTFSLT
ncbi:MAG: hypothetical protein ACOY0R_14895, partial [Chloroflexota bacterium]